MSTSLERIKGWFSRAIGSAERVVEEGTPVATTPPGAESVGMGDTERETSTNAQVEGAADEPWPGNT